MNTDTMTYIAPAIHCDHCKRAIEEAVGALPGVEAVAVAVASRRVEIRFDPAQVSPAQIEATMEEEGYPVDR